MIISNLVGVIADDLTGANDTALQFKKCNAKTKILLDYSVTPKNDENTEIWAISTECHVTSVTSTMTNSSKKAMLNAIRLQSSIQTIPIFSM